MLYFVKGEFVEENLAGRSFEEQVKMTEMIVFPSLEMLEKDIQAKKITGGVVSGERTGLFVLEAQSNEAVGEYLRNFPWWTSFKWTVSPLQSPHSAMEQDKASFKRAREMLAGRK